MMISGFTIIKDAEINDFPVVEAIKSLLPIVDEMIVLVGESNDGTKEKILEIQNPKIKVFESVWNTGLRSGGAVLAEETNKALKLVDPKSDWAFYIQGDEVVHEKDYKNILAACKKHLENTKVEGLLFNYLHFYATYDYIADGRSWYPYEVRIIRPNRNILSYKDAQGFRVGNKKKLYVKKANAAIYHYGWVKNPAQMKRKIDNVARYWHDDSALKNVLSPEEIFDYSKFSSLRAFTGEHPETMLHRISLKNWKVTLDISKKRFSLKDWLFYHLHNKFGLRPFSFRNYKILK